MRSWIGHVALLGLFDDDGVRSRVATPKLHNFATTYVSMVYVLSLGYQTLKIASKRRSELLVQPPSNGIGGNNHHTVIAVETSPVTALDRELCAPQTQIWEGGTNDELRIPIIQWDDDALLQNLVQ
jgi:hypothetical protein